MIQNKCQQKAFLPQIYKQSCMAAGVIRDTATAGTSVSSLEGSEEEIFCQLSFCLSSIFGCKEYNVYDFGVDHLNRSRRN